LALSALFSAQPSYSDYVFGYSSNAVTGGSSWRMPGSVFPTPTVEGVDINGVFYRYTAVKQPGDPYTVSIQNKDAVTGGYIFRETDDWSGGSGGTIQKYVPVPYSPLGNWGDGAIDEVGIGSVQDATVLYSFRYNSCAGVTDNPGCPGYVPPQVPVQLEFTPYDAMSDDAVLTATAPTDRKLYDDEELKEETDEQSKEGERLEKALAAVENSLTIGNSMTQAAILQAMNTATNLTGYYAANLKGGVYKDAVVMPTKKLPDSKFGARVGLAQQVLHEKMVNEQWR
jgi:hypothetical protein